MKNRELNDFEKHIILEKGTELPFSGEYYRNKKSGTYMCRQCGTPLYRSADKFESGCGWPSFDDELPEAVRRTLDADGKRTEITCNTCGGHLGHVFVGEGFTEKNTRHCVNSISMEFIPDKETATPDAEEQYETAIFAGGCFWGVEHYMKQAAGVISVESGYIGGKVRNPTYEEVCTGTTGHAEAVKVTFDPKVTSYEELARLFFEIHDPTQEKRQGPDIGEQYRSELFYINDTQKAIAEKLIDQLVAKGYDVATRVTPASSFWLAENYHQDYYNRKGSTPYCHKYTKRF